MVIVKTTGLIGDIVDAGMTDKKVVYQFICQPVIQLLLTQAQPAAQNDPKFTELLGWTQSTLQQFHNNMNQMSNNTTM